MAEKEEKYPVDKRFRIKNRDMEENFNRLQASLEDNPETRKYSDQATIGLAINLAVKKLEEIREEQEKLDESVPE